MARNMMLVFFPIQILKVKMNTNTYINNNTNIKSGIEFPIELNEANITIREKKGTNHNIANLDKFLVSAADAAISKAPTTMHEKLEYEFWKGYDEAKNELQQYLQQPVRDPIQEYELRDNFKEYNDVKQLMFPNGRTSQYIVAKARESEKEKEVVDAWLETGRKLTGNLELQSLEEAREVWLQNEVKYAMRMAEAKEQKEKREQDKYLKSLVNTETPAFTALISAAAEYEQKYGYNDDLDLSYYDSVPLHERYKWDGCSSSDDEN